MVESIGDLFIAGNGVDEVVLDIGKKLVVGSFWSDKVKMIADSLSREGWTLAAPACLTHCQRWSNPLFENWQSLDLK